MDEYFELKKIISNLKPVIEFRLETINIINKVLEKSNSKIQNQKDIEILTDKIMTEYSKTIDEKAENNLPILKNTLKVIFKEQLKSSIVANKIRLVKKNPPSIFE